jgi:hypothetical protein
VLICKHRADCGLVHDVFPVSQKRQVRIVSNPNPTSDTTCPIPYPIYYAGTMHIIHAVAVRHVPAWLCCIRHYTVPHLHLACGPAVACYYRTGDRINCDSIRSHQIPDKRIRVTNKLAEPTVQRSQQCYGIRHGESRPIATASRSHSYACLRPPPPRW